MKSLWGYNSRSKTRGTNKVKDLSDLSKRTWVWTRGHEPTPSSSACTDSLGEPRRVPSNTREQEATQLCSNVRTQPHPTPAASRNSGNLNAKPSSHQVAWSPTNAHAVRGYAATRSQHSLLASWRSSPKPEFHKQVIYQPSTKEKLPRSSKVVI